MLHGIDLSGRETTISSRPTRFLTCSLFLRFFFLFPFVCLVSSCLFLNRVCSRPYIPSLILLTEFKDGVIFSSLFLFLIVFP
jgi:hypothetical protein